MLSYDTALAQILDAMPAPSVVQIPLADTPGMFLAEDLVSTLALPPFANSAMDGYAVRFADVAGAANSYPVTLPLAGMSAAGDGNVPALPPGRAMRIMTGAPLPAGADTIVPIEDADADTDTVQVREVSALGRYVRAAGEDILPGDLLAARGTQITPREVAVAAAVGRATLATFARPRVAVIATGDELAEPGQTLLPGQIYNSNSYALAAQVAEAGGIVVQQLIAGDTPDALRAALDACAGCDILLTSGGVSVGAFDYVKTVFAERGTLDFWRVAIRPGRPLAFGQWGRTLFFGLPGNPVSSLVTFELFVRPALRRLLGDAQPQRQTVRAVLTQEARHEPGRRSFLRGRAAWNGAQWQAEPDARQGSHQMSALPRTNALLVVPEDAEALPAGAEIDALLL